MNKTLKDFSNISYDEIISNIKSDSNIVFDHVNEENKNPSSKKYIAIKDIHTSVDMPVTASSNVLKNYVAKYDSHVVKTLRSSGYNIVGTLNMDEFAMGGSNTNSAFGTTPNAIDNNNIAGGSSGASAYAVAKGLVPVATGTDTGGSVRQPAALNGIFGFKPTYGLISRYGTISFASSFDTIGVFANNLIDLQTVTKDLIVKDENDQTSFIPEDFDLSKGDKKLLKDFKVCVLNEFESINCDEYVDEEYSKIKDFLVEKGVKIEKRSVDTVPHALDLYILLAYAEAASNLSRYDGIIYGNKESDNGEPFVNSRNLFGSEVKKRLIIGTLMLSKKNSKKLFEKAQKVRNKMKQDFNEIFEEYDLIISPSLNKSKVSLTADTSSKEFYMSDILNIPANLCGIPAVSYPLKRNLELNPVGLQVMAKKYDDAKIFNFMKILEKELYE